jgi:hypothetical protein
MYAGPSCTRFPTRNPRRIHERDMHESLGEIAELTLCSWIVLLGEKADVIA